MVPINKSSVIKKTHINQTNHLKNIICQEAIQEVYPGPEVEEQWVDRQVRGQSQPVVVHQGGMAAPHQPAVQGDKQGQIKAGAEDSRDS